MSTRIKIVNKVPDTQQPDVTKTDTVTWETDLTLTANQHLKVQLDSEYVLPAFSTGHGKKTDNKVDLKMKLTDGGDQNVHIPYVLYLVTERTGLPTTEVEVVRGSTTGPCLVIDDIGKPPMFCRKHPHEHDEEECEVLPAGGHQSGRG